MISLVGYTGFVGSNICSEAGDDIKGLYNSKNIQEAYGTKPEILIYTGLRAEKYLANSATQRDLEQIIQAEENIKKISPQRLVLISTIDVFKVPKNVDETSVIETDGLHAYGYNRYLLELWVRDNYPDALIIRLPALFGKNIKKNFIYDYINVIPSMLKADKFNELCKSASELKTYYNYQDNGFYKVNVSDEEKSKLKEIFKSIGFSALNFTDSRSRYQFYNLKRLWHDINVALNADIKLWHPATEPISIRELYHYLNGSEFVNELDGEPVNYNYRTIYDSFWNGEKGYIENKASVMQEINGFICEEKESI